MDSRSQARLALRANELTVRFVLDSRWGLRQPSGVAFPGDHLSAAWLNIPAVEYAPNPHSDYHTPKDQWPWIDNAKCVTWWV